MARVRDKTAHVEQVGGFGKGILSKRFWYNKATPFYQSGVDNMLNMMPTPSGNLQRRLPTVFNEDSWVDAGASGAGRIVPWKLADGNQLFVTINSQGVVVHTLESSGVMGNIVGNPEFDQGLEHWDRDNFGSGEQGWGITTYNGDNLVLTRNRSPNNPRPWIEQVFDIPQETDTFDLSIVYGSQMLSVSNFSMHAVPVIVTVEHVGGTDSFVSTIEPSTVSDPWSGEPVDGFRRGVYVIQLKTDLPITGQIRVRLEQDDTPNVPGGNPANDGVYFNVSSFYLRTVIASGEDRPSFPCPYDDDEIARLQYQQNPYEDQMVLVCGTKPVHELVFNAGVWSFDEVTWEASGEPNFGANGYPAAVGTYQGRLVLARSMPHPQRVCMSKPAAWRDFALADTEPPTADDGVEFTLSQPGAIQWVYGQKDLLIGTEDAEWVVTSERGLVIAGDIDARLHTSLGSRLIQCVVVGDRVFFVGNSGDRISYMRLQVDTAGWMPGSASYWCDDLMQAGVKRVLFCRDPWPHLVAVTNNGNILAMFYGSDDGGLDNTGWTKWDYGYRVIDACVVRENNQDVIKFMMESSDVNGPFHFVSTTVNPSLAKSNFGRNIFYADYQQTLSYTDPTTTIQLTVGTFGIPYYVRNSDGIIEGPIMSSESGVIEVENASTGFLVGEVMNSEVKTLPLAIQYGGHDSIKSFSEVGVRLLASSEPLITTGHVIDSDPMTAPDFDNIPSGPVVYVENSLGHDVVGQITVNQPWPTNLCLVTIFGKAEIGDI